MTAKVVVILDSLSQGLSFNERIIFLLVHMLQMEMLVVLLGTALVSLVLYFRYKKEGKHLGEQTFTRNLAAALTSIALFLWLAGRVFR